MKNKLTFTIVKERGRWGTIHFKIKELCKGDYQDICNIDYRKTP